MKNRRLASLMACTTCSALTVASAAAASPVEAPEWTRDLVIYQLNPRGFTSPDGAGDGDGSGTFNSLRDKLDYIEELGVNAIWLGGFTFSKPGHFFNLWMVYANVHPEVVDPVLGTEQELKDLIADAHSRDIKVFVDVVTHGVVDESPLIADHPDWFEGRSWRMTDFNCANQEFLAWWIDVWVAWAVEFGIDGYRLDLDYGCGGRATWDEIATRCAASGHPVVVFGEDDLYHFQEKRRPGSAGNYSNNPSFDVPATWLEQQDDEAPYASVRISGHDNGFGLPAGNYYQLRGSRAKLAYGAMFSPFLPILFSGEEFDASQVPLPNLDKDLYDGSGTPGGLMYGTWIQWDELESDRGTAFLRDFKRIVAIRRAHRDVLHAERATIGFVAPSYEASGSTAAPPYIMYKSGEKAVLVLGNQGFHDAVDVSVQVPLADMGLAGLSSYELADLWTEEVSSLTEMEATQLDLTVPPDLEPGGGFRVLALGPPGVGEGLPDPSAGGAGGAAPGAGGAAPGGSGTAGASHQEPSTQGNSSCACRGAGAGAPRWWGIATGFLALLIYDRRRRPLQRGRI